MCNDLAEAMKALEGKKKMYFDIVLCYQLLGKINCPVRLLRGPPSPFLPPPTYFGWLPTRSEAESIRGVPGQRVLVNHGDPMVTAPILHSGHA